MLTIGKQDRPGDCSLYIHVPFCTVKCGYCHFYVIPYEKNHEKAYLEGIEKEWQLHKPLLEGRRIVSIYFGGGTPSLLHEKTIEYILRLIFDEAHLFYSIADSCEITLEANPESVSLEKMRALKKLGINRLSIGVQSLDDHQLVLLDRRHLATKAIQALEDSHASGIHNLSIDLMYDIPGQTLDSWQRTVDRAMQLPISHLSLYNLTIEPHTLFFKKRKALQKQLPTPEASVEMLEYATTSCARTGLKRYEISAFAKEGYFSRHNTGYWIGRPFLGLGPSAFSYFQGKRFKNVSSLQKWLSTLHAHQSPIDFEETLSSDAAFRELLAIHLRLLEGIDWTLFTQQHGKVPSGILTTIQDLCQQGLLQQQENIVLLTEKGQLFYDSVAEALI